MELRGSIPTWLGCILVWFAFNYTSCVERCAMCRCGDCHKLERNLQTELPICTPFCTTRERLKYMASYTTIAYVILPRCDNVEYLGSGGDVSNVVWRGKSSVC